MKASEEFTAKPSIELGIAVFRDGVDSWIATVYLDGVEIFKDQTLYCFGATEGEAALELARRMTIKPA